MNKDLEEPRVEERHLLIDQDVNEHATLLSRVKRCDIKSVGIILGILAAFCYALESVISTVVIKDSVHPFEVLALLKIMNCLISLFHVLYYRTYMSLDCKSVGNLSVFSVLISAAVGSIFFARQFITPVEAISLQETHCMFTFIISMIFFSYKPKGSDALVVIFMISGVMLICQPPFLFGKFTNTISNQIVGTMLSLSSGFFASSFSCYKYFIREVDPILASGFSSLFMVIIFGTACYLMDQLIFVTDTKNIIYIIICGFSITIGSYIHLKAISLDSVMKVAFGLMFCVPFVTILQLIILNQYPNYISAIGIGLIFVSSFIVIITSKHE